MVQDLFYVQLTTDNFEII